MLPAFSTSLDWIDSQRQRMADLLVSWGGINSGSHHVTGLARQAAAIGALVAELGVQCREIPLADQETLSETGAVRPMPLGRVLAARSPARGGPRVLLGIHYDTVYGPEHAFQHVTPLEGGRLRGPGVCDAKGGLLVLLFALMALARSPFAERLDWEIFVNPDEELGSPGSAALFEAAARGNDVGLLFEPVLADGALASARKGSGNFTFIAHGRSAHAGRNIADGRNAIHALARLVTALEAMPREIAGISVNTGFVHGGGPVNVVPDRALCHFNIRIETAAQQAAVEERLAMLARGAAGDGIAVECRGAFHAPPKPLTGPVEALLHHLAECGKELGMPITWHPTGGTCDGNRLAAAGLPTVDSLGVRGGEIHTPSEFMDLDSLAEQAKLVALFLMRLAAGEIRLQTLRAMPRQEVVV